jgi:hypothetical protein
MGGPDRRHAKVGDLVLGGRTGGWELAERGVAAVLRDDRGAGRVLARVACQVTTVVVDAELGGVPAEVVEVCVVVALLAVGVVVPLGLGVGCGRIAVSGIYLLTLLRSA